MRQYVAKIIPTKSSHVLWSTLPAKKGRPLKHWGGKCHWLTHHHAVLEELLELQMEFSGLDLTTLPNCLARSQQRGELYCWRLVAMAANRIKVWRQRFSYHSVLLQITQGIYYIGKTQGISMGFT